ncbi:MAG: hypothetical protein HY579_00530 [Nitrospinae bacterium]|nr:hypothetical protein [Nitrospinota bacterium]
MNKLETVEKLVYRLPCPICSRSEFQVNLNCELPKSECDFHAVCGHCQYKFVVTSDTNVMEEFWLRIGKHVAGKGCPACGDSKLHLEFLCDAKSADCFFLVRCSDHNHFSRLCQDGAKFLF